MDKVFIPQDIDTRTAKMVRDWWIAERKSIEATARYIAREILGCSIRNARGFVVATLTDAEVAADANRYMPPRTKRHVPIVHRGDRVRDPIDGAWRTVTSVDLGTVHLADGGVMNIDECHDIRLPSESLC